jgi:hypothetical protein
MTYEVPELNRLGTATSVILGPDPGDPLDGDTNPEVTSQGDLVLGLDD